MLALLVCGGPFVACGESEGSKPGGSGSTGNAAVDELVRAYCGTVKSCCRAAGYPPGPVADCEERFSRLGEFQAVLAGTVVFSEPERTECVELLRRLGGTCELPSDSPCSRIYEGTVENGGSCESSIECRHGAGGVACVTISVGDEEPHSGECRPLTVGQVGSPCFRTIDEDAYSVGYSTSMPDPPLGVCDRRQGLYCDYDTYTCRMLHGMGETCGECVSGLYCRDEDAVCVPQLPAGSPCEYFGQCEGELACIDGVCVRRTLTSGDLCEGDLD
ncbi:MAG TPA: hypothetical protein VFZ53_08270 [Polyangiaceae bacterium]